MENDKPSPPDIIVIGVWILIGLAIAFSLFDASKLKNVELYVQLVAALATAGSVYFAYRAVQVANEELNQARADRKEEAISKRPYFTFIEGRLGEQGGDEPSSFVESLFVNVGMNPAGSITGYAVFITDMGYEDNVQTIKYDPIGDVPSRLPFRFNMSGFNLPDAQEDWHYVVFILQYIDAMTKGEFEQVFYLQGPRYVPHLGLHQISHVIKPRLDNQINWASLKRKGDLQ